MDAEERRGYGIENDPEALHYDVRSWHYLPAWVLDAEDAEDLALERDLADYYVMAEVLA